jgi:hypothetical protein
LSGSFCYFCCIDRQEVKVEGKLPVTGGISGRLVDKGMEEEDSVLEEVMGTPAAQ